MFRFDDRPAAISSFGTAPTLLEYEGRKLSGVDSVKAIPLLEALAQGIDVESELSFTPSSLKMRSTLAGA